MMLLVAGGMFQPQATPAPMTDTVPTVAAPVGPVERPVLEPYRPDFYGAANAPQRPRAVEYSEAYHIRLTIHHLASYVTLPLFVAEYILGRQLYNSQMNGTLVSPSTRSTHRTVAAGVAGLFAVNTVTGAWNLWDSRKTKEGALRRYLHSGLMFLADAGFVATGLTAPHGSRRYVISPATLQSQSRTHRTIALASMGTALASYGMMLFWKD
jgi:hypothetical protein